MSELRSKGVRRFSLAQLLFLLALIPVPFGNAAAETTEVRLLFRDGPVIGVPVKIIDVRSGIIVATTETDKRGYAKFEGLQSFGLYEAQTPNGNFVSRAFEAGSPVELRVPDAKGPLFGFALSVTAEMAHVFGSTDVGCEPLPAAPENCSGNFHETGGSGDAGGITGSVIRGRIFGPELGPYHISFFIEGGVAPSNSFKDEPFSEQTNTFLGQPEFTGEEVLWERKHAWDIGAGVALPLPVRSVRVWAEFSVGFHRESLDFKVTGEDSPIGLDPNPGPGLLLSSSSTDIDSVAIGVQFPVELWRRGFSSILLELGLGARFPQGGDLKVTLGDSNSERIHSYDPGTTLLGHVGLRFQFGYSPMPSLR